MAQSWFYLTLWHGTPDEFTSKVNVEIEPVENAVALIHEDDTMSSGVETVTISGADVDRQYNADVDINTVMGVVWCVG